MNRKLVVVGLSAAMSLAVLGLPAGAQPAPKTPDYNRAVKIAVPGGIKKMSQLRVTGQPSTPDTWTTGGNMTVGVSETGGGAMAGGRLYVPGGFLDDGSLYDKMQVYNGTTWTADIEAMPFGPWADAAICADPTGKIHVVNGVDGAFLYAAHQIYDPAAPAGARWSTAQYPVLADGTTTYYSQDSGCGFLNGKMYLYGGYAVVDPNPAAVTRATWVWDPAQPEGMQWADTGRLMVGARFWHGYATSGNTALFAAGGTNNLITFAALNTAEAFLPASGWRALGNLPQGRLAPGTGATGTHVLVYGGASGPSGGFFTLEPDTLHCAAPCAGGFANINQDVPTPRWFAPWGNQGSTFYQAGGAGSGGVTLTSTERFTP